MVDFAAATTLQPLTIFNRTDCCRERGSKNVSIFGGCAVVYSRTINAFNQTGTVTFDASAVVPEP